jgi:hypothetical protein
MDIPSPADRPKTPAYHCAICERERWVGNDKVKTTAIDNYFLVCLKCLSLAVTLHEERDVRLNRLYAPSSR